jgi:hypothetical protein
MPIARKTLLAWCAVAFVAGAFAGFAFVHGQAHGAAAARAAGQAR